MSKYRLIQIVFSACFILIAGCTSQDQSISYSRDVRPLIANNCLECHQPGAPGYEKSGLSMASYDSLMQGTKFGPVIKPGDSLSSTLVILIEGRADASINMPHGDREPLTKKEIQSIRHWIDAGASNN